MRPQKIVREELVVFAEVLEGAVVLREVAFAVGAAARSSRATRLHERDDVRGNKAQCTIQSKLRVNRHMSLYDAAKGAVDPTAVISSVGTIARRPTK